MRARATNFDKALRKLNPNLDLHNLDKYYYDNATQGVIMIEDLGRIEFPSGGYDINFVEQGFDAKAVKNSRSLRYALKQGWLIAKKEKDGTRIAGPKIPHNTRFDISEAKKYTEELKEGRGQQLPPFIGELQKDIKQAIGDPEDRRETAPVIDEDTNEIIEETAPSGHTFRELNLMKKMELGKLSETLGIKTKGKTKADIIDAIMVGSDKA